MHVTDNWNNSTSLKLINCPLIRPYRTYKELPPIDISRLVSHDNFGFIKEAPMLVLNYEAEAPWFRCNNDK